MYLPLRKKKSSPALSILFEDSSVHETTSVNELALNILALSALPLAIWVSVRLPEQVDAPKVAWATLALDRD